MHRHQQSATKHQFLEFCKKQCAIMAYPAYVTVTYTYENDWWVSTLSDHY